MVADIVGVQHLAGKGVNHQNLPRADAASIAAHYGSVSVVTFAVASSYLASRGEPAEGYMVVFLALLELPALVVGVALARKGAADTRLPWLDSQAVLDSPASGAG